MRRVYVMRNGELVPKSEAASSRSAHIIRDRIDETWHPADGRSYTSKSQFRRVTREHGCIEIGNERQTQRPSYEPVTKQEVAEAVRMVEQGYRPRVLSETD